MGNSFFLLSKILGFLFFPEMMPLFFFFLIFTKTSFIHYQEKLDLAGSDQKIVQPQISDLEDGKLWIQISHTNAARGLPSETNHRETPLINTYEESA